MFAGFHQFPEVAQSGIERKKAATGATYTQPVLRRPLTALDSSAAAGLGSEGRRRRGSTQPVPPTGLNRQTSLC